MGQLSVGEDLFATFAAAALLAFFAVSLAHSYNFYAQRKGEAEHLDLALDVAERLRNDVLAKHEGGVYPGLINPEAFDGELESYGELLARQGVDLRVEVRALDGALLLEYGRKPGPIEGLFSPPVSVALPVAVARTEASRELAELVVQIWR